jgi:TRAP transporter TAXI family solute receptor
MSGKPTLFVRPAFWLYGITGALILVAVAAIIGWLGPLPPKVVVMSTGAAGSDYAEYARQYQAILKRSGVQLRLLPSAGALDNLRRLEDARSGVSVGFAQGGLSSEAQSPDLESLGTLFYQPFWLFVRREIPALRPADLAGKRVAIGPEGSGTQILAKKFLALNGIDESQLHLLPLPAVQAGEALLRGEIDVAAMVASADTAIVRRLLASSDVNVVSAPRADAYVALEPYLTKLVLPAGVGNLATNRPPSDVNLVATEASLIIRKDLHPAVQYLLLEAATEIHSAAGLFRKAGEFPAPEQVDLPVSKDARQYYKSGPPFLQRYLPYGLAVLGSRLLVLLIPVIGVAYPLLRMAPTLYGWSMRRRIFRLYGELKYIEVELEARGGTSGEDLVAQLQRLEERANHLQVPFAYAHFLYQLRIHIAQVRARIQPLASQAARPQGEGQPAAPQARAITSSKGGCV